MSRKICIVCHELFNTKDHKPLIIPKCFHNICEEVASWKEFVCCPVCNVTYSELLATDLQEDKNLLEYISAQELYCSKHPQNCAAFFCVTHNEAQCFDCKHKTPCKIEDLADNDSLTLLKVSIERVAEVCNLNKAEVMQRQAMLANAEETYQLLAGLLQVQRPIHEMCSAHRTTPTQLFNLKELRPVCQRCVEKYQVHCCDVSDTSAKMRLEHAIRKYSESLHFYLFPEAILKFLAISPSLDIGIFVQVAHELDNLRYKKRRKPDDLMYCPLCIRPSSDFHRLPCPFAIHAICASCDFNLHRQKEIFCPLDHNSYIRETNQDRVAGPQLTKPEFAQFKPLDMTECENNPRAAPIPESSTTPILDVIEVPQEDRNQFCAISLRLFQDNELVRLPCSHSIDSTTVRNEVNANGYVQCKQCRVDFGLSRLRVNIELKSDLGCSRHQALMQYFCTFHHVLFCSRGRNQHTLCCVETMYLDTLEHRIEESIHQVKGEYTHWNQRLKSEFKQLPRMNLTGKYQLLKDLLRYQPQHEPEESYGSYFRDKHELYRVKGTPIPAPKVFIPGVFPLNRFFALQPPEACPQELLDPLFHPWIVRSSQKQTEAFVFRLSRDAQFRGLTLACPIDGSKFYIDRAELRHGIGTMDPLEFTLLPSSLLVDPEDALVKDFLCDKPSELFAETPYTLLLELKALDRHSDLAFYQGNAITAPDILFANETMLVEIGEAQSDPGEIIGQNNIRGPILRLFFSLPPDELSPS